MVRHPDNMRRQASALFTQGSTGAEVARRLGIARSTAWTWRRHWECGALLATARRGRRKRLRNAQVARLARAFLAPPSAYGMAEASWSLRSIALLIERETGVRYHHRHVTRLLRQAGWTAPPVPRYEHAARYLQPIETPVGPMNLLLPGPR